MIVATVIQIGVMVMFKTGVGQVLAAALDKVISYDQHCRNDCSDEVRWNISLGCISLFQPASLKQLFRLSLSEL